MRKIITVFGSSVPVEGEVEYNLGYRLGKLLAENNFDVCTGGYEGIMSAVAKGAVEAGGQAIGITCSKQWENKPNKYLTEQIDVENIFERLKLLLYKADGFVVLNGSTGTLLELAAVWELLNKKLMPPKPFIILGDTWMELYKLINKRMEFESREKDLAYPARNIFDCVEFLTKVISE